MSNYNHDPSKYIKDLQQLLVSDKKRIGFLFGAGTSLANKNEDSITIPAIGNMTKKVEEKVFTSDLYKNAINQIKDEIGPHKFNIETLLSSLESKYQVIYGNILNGLKKDEYTSIIQQVKSEIIEIVDIHKEIISDNKLKDTIQVDFAEWIGRARRRHPIEVFTTNYDLLFEIGLEEKEVPYYDGFTGSYNPFFNSESIEDFEFLPDQTKLWKIHGSLGWKMDNDKIIRKECNDDNVVIYPSSLKYNNSKKQPYTALMDRLTNFLKQPDTILIVCGYSFGDEHINERIVTALKSNPMAHVFVFYFDAFEKDAHIVKLAQESYNLSIYGQTKAVIGSRFGTWKLSHEPDKTDPVHAYFEQEEINVGDPWTGLGTLKLPDFCQFVYFLKSMMNNLGDNDNA